MASPLGQLSDPIQEFLVATLASSCAALGAMFEQLVPPSEMRFQVALYLLWPALTRSDATSKERIQAAYLLHHLYYQFDIRLNPFRIAFQEVIEDETRGLVNPDKGSSSSSSADSNMQPSPLALTLDCILRGRGSELAPYSPTALADGVPHLTGENISPKSVTSSTSGSSGVLPAPQNTTPHLHPLVVEPQQPYDHGNSEDAQVRILVQEAPHRILSIPEQRMLIKGLPNHEFDMSIYSDFPFVIARNPGISFHLLSRLISVSLQAGRERCYEMLGRMRPMMVNFDLMAKLLQDPTLLRERDASGSRNVADAVRNGALGEFLENCEAEIEEADMHEPAGYAEGPCGMAVQHFSRFCLLLIRFSILIPTKDAETEQVLRFALHFSRYKEANTLYRTISAIRNGAGGGS